MSKVITQTHPQLFALSELPHDSKSMVVERLFPSGDLLITKTYKGIFYKRRFCGYPIAMAKKLFTQQIKEKDSKRFINQP